MMKLSRKTDPLLKMMNNALIDLPSPSNISLWWNFGSLLGVCLITQIITGLFLTMHYSSNIDMAFNSIDHIYRNVNYGWLIRSIHANGASWFFISLFLHIGRGIYYNSYKLLNVWFSGIMIFLLTMMTAFLGYVLPWGQMSYWGATVITNLLSAIPYIGNTTVQWIWGGFAVNKPTLTRFFMLHFLLPFILTMMIMIHLLFLHQKGSNNPLGINSNIDKIPFHPYFTFKDLMSMIFMLISLIILSLYSPFYLSDPDNFSPANPMITPIHIQPEWYFLFAYAILRSIPNKLGGILALISSIIILMIIPYTNKNVYSSNKYYPLNQTLFYTFILTFMLLTWLGMKPVEPPYIIISQIFTLYYFMFFMLNPLIYKYWDNLTS